MREGKMMRNERELVAVSLIRGVGGPGLNASLGLFFPSVSIVLGVGVSTLSWSVSIGALAGMLFLPFAGHLFARLGVRKTTFIGVCLLCISCFLHGFATHYIWWYLLAVPFGIGTVIVVNVLGPLILDGGEGYGASLGKMMTLAGVIAIPIQPLLTMVIAARGMRVGYFTAGILALCVMLPCVMALPRRCVSKQKASGEMHMPPRSFARIYLFLAIIVAYNAFHQHLAVLGSSRGFSEREVGVALALAMGGVAVGGIFIGYVTHHLGGIAGGYATALIGGSGIFLLLPPHIACFMIGCFLHGAASAAIGITAQTIARERCEGAFGTELTRLLTAIPLSTVIATPLWGILYDHTGSYTLALWSILALLGGGVICLVGLKRDKRTRIRI